MKNIKTLSILLISASLIISCKKKESTPTPSPTPAPPSTPAHVNSMTANVNNQNWAMYVGQYVTGSFISSFGNNNFTFGGLNSLTNPYTSVQVSFTYSTGIFNLTSFGNYVGKYKDANNTYFTSRTGTLNISTFDTVGAGSSIVKQLKANFSFQTDTINNQSYTITNGVIDFEK
jgi:hypothetical protein